MNVNFIYHSGFLVETEQAYFLFDWFAGEIPPINQEKPLFVFASHSHRDHFSKKIFGLSAQNYILSDDISKHDYPKETNVRNRIICMGAHEEIELAADSHISHPGKVHVYTLASNDLGVAFVITTPKSSIYHAGDLNNWWWDGDAEDRRLERFYHEELNRIKGMHFEVAMIPYDLRLAEPGYGVRDFLQYCTADQVYGMHLNSSREEGKRKLAADPLLKNVVML